LISDALAFDAALGEVEAGAWLKIEQDKSRPDNTTDAIINFFIPVSSCVAAKIKTHDFLTVLKSCRFRGNKRVYRLFSEPSHSIGFQVFSDNPLPEIIQDFEPKTEGCFLPIIQVARMQEKFFSARV
jgi:hypothetical protein